MQKYDYTKRYRGTHRTDRLAAIETVRLNGVRALCPFCLRPTSIDRYSQPSIFGQRVELKRWMEYHHLLGYERYDFWSAIPVCSECHVPKFHNSIVWVVCRNRDQNRNILWFRYWVRVRWLIVVLILSLVKRLICYARINRVE